MHVRMLTILFKPSCLTVLFLLAALAGGCSGQEAGSAPAPEKPAAVPVVVTPVTRVTMREVVEALGATRSFDAVDITAEVTETVRAVHFESGQRVKRGDTLVELTDEEEHATYVQALARLRDEDKRYRRIHQLHKKDTVSRQDLDSQAAALDAARAEVRALQARMADRLILAPFDGVLGARRISPGALVAPGTVITTLDDTDPMYLDFTVPALHVAALHAGMPIEAVSPAYTGRTFNGTVESLDPRVDPETRALTLRALLPNPDGALLPGMLLTVGLPKREAVVLALPEGALVPLGREQFVFVVADGKAERRKVAIGLREPRRVEVAEGLAQGEAVVVEGVNRLRDGALVEVVETRPLPEK